MRVVVTGANGYIGQGVVKQLLNDHIDVIAVDISDKYIDKRASIVICNIFEDNNFYHIFDKSDAILHLAWRDGFLHNSINHINDLPKHVNFLKTMLEHGVQRIAVMGSMHEIGFFEGSIDESTVCHPQTLYGIAKDALRNIVALLADEYSISYQWLRGFYIVGNSSHGNSIFSKITLAERKGNLEFPFTWGQNQYDFLDYNRFCFQVASAIEQNAINGIINICNGKPEKLADRVEKFIQDNNYKIKLKYGAFPDRPYDSKAIWGNNKKINNILENRNYSH